MDVQLTPNFKLSEFRCPCCNDARAAAALELALRLQPVRELYGVIHIQSGYRCPRHNDQVHGARNSAHLIGLAADILCETDDARFTLLQCLLACNFRRIGIGKTIIHADIAPLSGPAIWTYYP